MARLRSRASQGRGGGSTFHISFSADCSSLTRPVAAKNSAVTLAIAPQ